MPTVSWYQSCAIFQPSETVTDPAADYAFATGKNFTGKVGLVSCDILALELDGIVNAVGLTLQPGSGHGSFLNTYLHEYAGEEFAEECRNIGSLKLGEVVVTSGGKLHCKHVIHAARPSFSVRGNKADALRRCYREALEAAVRNGIRSLAFPCLSTGGYGFPKMQAADIATDEVFKFYRDQAEYGPAKDATNELELVIFCAVQPGDLSAYKQLLP
jgi:O-acetyl-ADP-ribose deacetylase